MAKAQRELYNEQIFNVVSKIVCWYPNDKL